MLSIYGQHQLQVARLLVYIDAIILGRECEAGKSECFNFPATVSYFKFLNQSVHNFKYKRCILFPSLWNLHDAYFILTLFSKFNMLRSLKCISVFTSFVFHYSVRTNTSQKFLLNSTVQ